MSTPGWFRCPVHRRHLADAGWDTSLRRQVAAEPHNITLTGKTKPNPSRKIGPRTSRVSREYTCSCGHTGWSTHIDLEHMEGRS